MPRGSTRDIALEGRQRLRHARPGIDGADRRTGHGQRVFTENSQSGTQWTFFGSESDDTPVTASKQRSRRLTNWSA